MIRALRDRALLSLFLVTGARVGAIGQLRRGDFVRHQRSGDHVGPAIMLRPGKTVHSDVVRGKFLPEIIGDWIQEWIDYVGTDADPEAPLWVHSPRKHLLVDEPRERRVSAAQDAASAAAIPASTASAAATLREAGISSSPATNSATSTDFCAFSRRVRACTRSHGWVRPPRLVTSMPGGARSAEDRRE